MINFD